MRLIGIILQLAALLLWSAGAFAQSLSAEAMANFQNQVAAVQAKKMARTEVQKKINASIVDYLHEVVLKDTPAALPKLKHDVKLSVANEVLVDIKAEVSPALIAEIQGQGGFIVNAFPQYQAIRALVPITAVEKIAAEADIIFIDKAAECTTNKATTSEGDVAHNVPLLRSKGYTGQGIKVGVLSDSVQSNNAHPLDYLTQVQATGDLPATVNVLPGQAGSGAGEGVAMMEIVYDLAPSGPLFFATAFGSPAGFANNIIALKDAGCQVIVDDVYYFNESPFQDDIISQAVTTVTNAGVAYFSAAGNSDSYHANNSGTWEGDYLNSNIVYGTTRPGYAHDFGGGVWKNQIKYNPFVIDLFWSDPLGASTNDYDLYVIDGSGNIIDKSINHQTGTQDPYEHIDVASIGKNYVNDYVVIVNFNGSAAPRFLHLQAYTNNRGITQGVLNYNTTGSTKGHMTIPAAFGVAAVSAAGRTSAFTGTEAVETFSSDGPRRVFYNPDGTAITPSNLLATGGKLRFKPDLTAADGVACSTPGFNPFYGTSAAAPHAAAMAAVLLSARPKLTAAGLRNALTKPALPTPSLWHEYSGYGISMANRALNYLNALGLAGALDLLLH